MTDEELNRFIHEEVMGKCIEPDYEKVSYNKAQVDADVCLWVCKKCKLSGGIAEETVYRQGVPYQKKYSKPKEYVPTYLEHNKHWGELLNWVMKQEWWEDFSYRNSMCADSELGNCVSPDLFANPRSLPEHIAEYLKREEGR